jgi:two-component system, NtrC family, response regulator AtoC
MERNLFGDTTQMDARRDQPDPPTKLHLLIMSPDVYRSIPLPSTGALMIGRLPSADIPIQDQLVSRHHAVLHLGDATEIEDLSSANGIRLRGALVDRAQRAPLSIGEPIFMGNTCLMLLETEKPLGHGRIWSHFYFEGRLEEECARAQIAGASFGLARLSIDRSLTWARTMPILLGELPPPHLIGAYGPNEYEILFTGLERREAEATLARLDELIAEAGQQARWGLAWFPEDARSAGALMDRARVPAQSRVTRTSTGQQPPAPGSPMARVYDLATRSANSTINVLLSGETGVGKEVLAQYIHDSSPRADKPMLCLNCAALTETLLESELFGYEKGAFTGAVAAKAGLLETAQGGTIFLDELGELPAVTQAKLLRVIERREVTRLGGLKPRTLNVRFISATHRDLEDASSSFRRDLYFRLNGINIVLPPLRERRAEILGLAAQFVSNISAELGLEPEPVISDQAMALLTTYAWPGNIRELRNVIERALVLCAGTDIFPEHLPLERMSDGRADPPESLVTLPPPPAASATGAAPLADDQRWQFERQRILEALSGCAGNQSRAAELLGMPRRTFVSKLDYYRIPRPQKSGREKPTR